MIDWLYRESTVGQYPAGGDDRLGQGFRRAALACVLLAVLLLTGCAAPLTAESSRQALARAVLATPTTAPGSPLASSSATTALTSTVDLALGEAAPTPVANGQPITAEANIAVPSTPDLAPVQSSSPLPLPTPTPPATLAGPAQHALPTPTPPATLAELTPQALPTPTARPATILPLPTPTLRVEPTPDAVARTAQVPILMYHYLSVPPPDANIYRMDLSVAPELFAAHLDAIQAAGYSTISLYDLLAHLVQGTPLPDRPVVLTFDDGYRDNFENALPLLQERGMTATFFVVTDFIDEQRPAYLTWEMVRAMHAAGMSIEAHGRNHVSLKGQDVDYLVWQALGSFEAIEREVGVRPRFVSYPAGEYDQRTTDIFQSANYWAGLTTVQGATHRSDDLFQLHRVRMRGTTTPEELLRLLALDW